LSGAEGSGTLYLGEPGEWSGPDQGLIIIFGAGQFMLEMNPEQRQAVEHGEGPLLVVAGPGTGKTRVITQRIVHLLSQDFSTSGRPPLTSENILALTFTDKAAAEMKRRVAEALPDLPNLPTLCTFHAFCYRTLRQQSLERRLLDKIDVWIFLRRRMAELGLRYYQKLAEPGAFLHDLNEFFSRCQDELIEPADFERYVNECECRLKKAGQEGHAATGENLEWDDLYKKQELAAVFYASRRLLEDAGASSLGSLISETVRLWQSRPDLLDQARARFRTVLVDEFQDTNYGQVELLRLLVPAPYNITAVGDDDQAIYRFRGASHGAFEMFAKAFPGQRTVYLGRNYRSTRRILRVAANVIVRNDRYAEKPQLISAQAEGCPVYLLRAHDAQSEAGWIAHEVQRLARSGASFAQMAVLYRAHGYRDALVEELRCKEIPFAIRGLSILSASVLREVLAYLRLVHSRHENVCLTRVLRDPRWRFPEALAQSVREMAWKDRCSLDDVIRHPAPAIAEALAETGWSQLDAMIKSVRWLAKKSGVTQVMDRLADCLGWHFLPGSQDLTYLETFREFLKSWEAKSETSRLAEFMEYFAYFLEAGGKVEAPEAPAARDAVQLMTIHAAKGLEFPVVFVIGVSPRKFPATERKPVIEFPAELRKGPPPPPNIHVQEERRLFFVAITRAQKRLYISSVAKEAKQQSVFVQDLLSDALVAKRDIEEVDVPDVPLRHELRRETDAPGGDRLPRRPAYTRTGQGNLFENGEVSPPGGSVSLETWARTAGGPHAAEKLQLSATAVEDYLDCPLKYKFHYLLRIPTAPQAALTFGNLMHQSIRHYFELRRRSVPHFAEIEEFYLKRWKALGFDDAYQEETYQRAGLEQLRSFVERQNALAIDCSRMQMEQAFRVDLGDLTLDGRIDQVMLLDPAQDRAVELTDYKTGRPRNARDAEKSLQLSVYALAAKRALHLNPVRLTFYNLTNNEPVSAARSPADLDAALHTVREVAVEVRKGRFDPTPGVACRWCNFISICPAHEDRE
jgi:DNA helicase II / ATP-dependent DNA helicase PcrA